MISKEHSLEDPIVKESSQRESYPTALNQEIFVAPESGSLCGEI